MERGVVHMNSHPGCARPGVALRLLGDFGLTIEGVDHPVPPASQRVIALVALAERPVRRARACATLWPDSTAGRARANLRSALWRVPDSDVATVLSTSSTHIGLADGVDVDYRTTVVSALDWTRGRPARKPLELWTALDAELLPDWEDAWLVVERERFRHLSLLARDAIAETLCADGRYGEAIHIGLGTIRSDPLRESAHRLVARAHAALGNVADAIRQCVDYEAMLAAELGVRPSPAMQDMLDGLRPGTNPAIASLSLTGGSARP